MKKFLKIQEDTTFAGRYTFIMRNMFGVTPWGRWFLEVLDSYRMGERLERGRRYANAGRVISLDLAEGRAFAKVEGKSNPFYKVVIDFPPLKEAEQVYRIIEDDLPLLARIAAGELPEEFLIKLKKKLRNMNHSLLSPCTESIIICAHFT